MGWSDFLDALRSHMDSKENMSFKKLLKEKTYTIRLLIFLDLSSYKTVVNYFLKMDCYVNSSYHIAIKCVNGM